MITKRNATTFCWLTSICLFLIGFLGTYFLYEHEILHFDTSDGHGHGPDYGTAEWASARNSGLLIRSTTVGALAGLAGMVITIAITPNRPRPLN